MRIETHASDRKQVAWAIGSYLDKPVHYDGVPRCSYSIGPFTVERDGAVVCEDEAAMNELFPLLRERGWMEETQEHLETPAETAAEEPEPRADQEAPVLECMGVCYKLAEFTVTGFTNFIKTLYTHQKLINSMLKEDRLHIDEETIDLLKEMNADSVEKAARVIRQEAGLGLNKGIDVKEENLLIDIPFDSEAPDAWKYGAKLLNTAADKAKEAHHASGKIIDPEPGAYKYCCHSWLIALGFGGPDFKALRAALLDHLPGYAAFRTTEKMDAHKAKFTERRRAARAQREADANVEN